MKQESKSGMPMSSMVDVTLLLEEVAQGNRDSANLLFATVYDELRKLAKGQFSNERADHTLQSTALVHEVWVKLIGNRDEPDWKNRTHFFAAAAKAMRQILVDSARARLRVKRGGDRNKLELQDQDGAWQEDEELVALDEALDELRKQDEPKARLVELRYFAGLTSAQAAEQIGVSPATADRYWAYARAWLRTRMED